MQTTMDEIKKENPMHADMIDKIPSMNLEETVKNLFAMEDLEHLLKMHADDLVEGKPMGSNQTTTTKQQHKYQYFHNFYLTQMLIDNNIL